MFLFSSFQQNISVFAEVIFGKKWVTDSCLTHALTGTVGGAEATAAPPPQFVGQTKPVGQYSLHSRAILAYYKNKWDKFCQFCGKYAI